MYQSLDDEKRASNFHRKSEWEEETRRDLG